MIWLSSGKPVTAAGVLMLWERGLVDLQESVARYVPEFGREGKEAITVWQLLTHTAGIRRPDTGFPHATWEQTLAEIYGMKIEKHWVPGLRAGYHQHSSWYVLGELIGRVTGVRCEQWLRENVLVPCGMTDTWLALDAARYRVYGARLGWMYDTRTSPPEPLRKLDSELGASRVRPSASCRGPARELARFYEMLRCGGQIGGVRLLKEETVAVMTTRQREGMVDQTLGHTVDWGLGVVINSAHHGPRVPYQFGPHASRETFGHGGSRSSVGFCHPGRKLAAAVIFNGRPGEAAHDQRMRETLGALYEDLALA
jgi:CubicO group peptidase (beta-lactamase class C family)